MMTDTQSGFQVLSSTNPDLRNRDYKKQRPHKKSRSGCVPCKVKKVKCDERKPICERCQRNRRPCVYSSSRSHDRRREHHQYKNADCVASISDFSAVTVISFPCPSGPKNGTSGIHLLHHFYANWDDIFHIPGRDELFLLSKSNALIRNTILAITACHLRHMSPRVLEHRIAEHYHQSLAIRDFQRALETPGKVLGQQGVDAMLLAALLLNMIAFTLPHHENGADDDDDPRSSWVFSSREDRLGWLALQAGLRPLLISLSAYLEKTVVFLDPIMFGHRRAGSWASARRGRHRPETLDIVPSAWIRAFKLTNNSSSCDSDADADPNDVLRPAAIALAYLRNIDPQQSKVFLNLMFLHKIHGDFRVLLYRKDERAMWLFGYWLGLMCRYDGIWWCERRVRRDYLAVRMFLDRLCLGERTGEEGLCWRDMMRELELAPVFKGSEQEPVTER